MGGWVGTGGQNTRFVATAVLSRVLSKMDVLRPVCVVLVRGQPASTRVVIVEAGHADALVAQQADEELQAEDGEHDDDKDDGA